MAAALPDPMMALPPSLAKAFAPIDSRALGVAVGLTLGGLVGAVTIFHLMLRPEDAPEIGLLASYFYGYSQSWSGAAVGLLWGSLTGFAIGWFAGAVRNLVLRVRVLLLRTRAELDQPFLDEIS
jgi:hypothetical protein